MKLNVSVAQSIAVLKRYTLIGVRYIKSLGLDAIIFGISAIATFTLVAEVAQLKQEVIRLNSKLLFDVDKARASLIQEMNYMYYEGCKAGTDYPEEYRNVVGFNEHSPVIFCGDLKVDWDQYVTNQAWKLGR